jgi:hypothetical protein
VRKRAAAHQLADGLMVCPCRVKRIFENRLVLKIYQIEIIMFFISQKTKFLPPRSALKEKPSPIRFLSAIKQLSRHGNAAASQYGERSVKSPSRGMDFLRQLG